MEGRPLPGLSGADTCECKKGEIMESHAEKFVQRVLFALCWFAQGGGSAFRDELLAQLQGAVPIAGCIHSAIHWPEDVVLNHATAGRDGLLMTRASFYLVHKTSGNQSKPYDRDWTREATTYVDKSISRFSEILVSKNLPLRVITSESLYREGELAFTWQLLVADGKAWDDIGKQYSVVADVHALEGQEVCSLGPIERYVFPREVVIKEAELFFDPLQKLVRLIGVHQNALEYITDKGIHVHDMRSADVRTRILTEALEWGPKDDWERKALECLLKTSCNASQRSLAVQGVRLRTRDQAIPATILFKGCIDRWSVEKIAKRRMVWKERRGRGSEIQLPPERLLQALGTSSIIIGGK